MSALDRDDDISLEVMLERFRDAWQDELHTAIPGRVESYDATSQTATVKPLIRRALPKSDGSFAYEPLPAIHAVPITFPGAGGWFLRFPLTAGDTVLLVVCERDLARWRVTGEESVPVDVRAHHLSHAVAIPGLRSRQNQLPTPTGDALELGHTSGATIRVNNDGTIQLGGTGATDLVALSSLVSTELTKIHTTLGSLTGAAFGVPYTQGGVAATKVKAL
jgi:hypothetical protein